MEDLARGRLVEFEGPRRASTGSCIVGCFAFELLQGLFGLARAPRSTALLARGRCGGNSIQTCFLVLSLCLTAIWHWLSCSFCHDIAELDNTAVYVAYVKVYITKQISLFLARKRSRQAKEKQASALGCSSPCAHGRQRGHRFPAPVRTSRVVGSSQRSAVDPQRLTCAHSSTASGRKMLQ